MAWMSTCPLVKGIKNKPTIDTVRKYTYRWTVNKILFLQTRVPENELFIICYISATFNNSTSILSIILDHVV